MLQLLGDLIFCLSDALHPDGCDLPCHGPVLDCKSGFRPIPEQARGILYNTSCTLEETSAFLRVHSDSRGDRQVSPMPVQI